MRSLAPVSNLALVALSVVALAVFLLGSAPNAAAGSVLIVFGDRDNAEAFSDLLGSSGLSCSLASRESLTYEGEAAVDLVVTLSCCRGRWSQGFFDWSGDSRVLAMGASGAQLLGQRGLLISNVWHGTHLPKIAVIPPAIVEGPLGALLTTPHDLGGATTITLHAGEGELIHVGAYDGGEFPEGTVGIGRELDDLHHWIIAKQGNYTLWGADSRVEDLTDEGSRLFTNLCWLLASAEPEPLIFPEHEFIGAGEYTGVLVGGHRDVRYFIPEETGRLRLRLEWDDDNRMMLLARPPFSREDGASPLVNEVDLGRERIGRETGISIHSFSQEEGEETPYRLVVEFTPGPVAEPSPPRPPAMALHPGEVAPDWTLPDIRTGDSVALSDLRGKHVLLDFWATRCGPCIGAMERELNPLWQRFGDRSDEWALISIGTNWYGETAEIQRAYVDDPDHRYPWLFVHDATGEVTDAHGVEGIPTMVLINPEGIIEAVAHHGVGRRMAQILEEASGVSDPE